jgi:leader peptidase (prepilin peptidase)/N-methyltransferase
VQPRSHCGQCGRTLTWWENVPLASWLALRGRCRTCHAWIGWRHPVVEAAVGVLWALIAWRSYDALPGIEIEFAAGMMFFCGVLVGLAVLDAEYLWLPNVVTLPSAALGIIWYLLLSEQVGRSLTTKPTLWIEAGERFLGILAAAGLILLIRWAYWLIRRREGIGLGDAKLMALLAAWLGLPQTLLAFGMGATLGAVAALVLLAIPSKRLDLRAWAAQKLPLGTFLCIGGIISSLWGQRMIDAYLRWAGF